MKKKTPPNWPLVAWALFALAIAVALPWILPQSLSPQSAPRKPSNLNHETVPTTTVPASGTSNREPAKPETFETWLKKEREKIGLVNASPAETLSEMQQRSESLTPKEIQILSMLALNERQTGDERFFAVELLAMNTSWASTRALEKISVQTPPRGTLESSLEVAIRARAIEGLGHTGRPHGDEALGRVLTRIDDQFLVDRAQRSRLAHQELVPPPEQQDHDTLNRVLQSQSN